MFLSVWTRFPAPALHSCRDGVKATTDVLLIAADRVARRNLRLTKEESLSLLSVRNTSTCSSRHMDRNRPLKVLFYAFMVCLCPFVLHFYSKTVNFRCITSVLLRTQTGSSFSSTAAEQPVQKLLGRIWPCRHIMRLWAIFYVSLLFLDRHSH